jgi:transcriptional regulator with XRE-family HTH domain
VLDRHKLEKFERKEYRDGYLETTVRAGIAYQIQALRAKDGLSQSEFAELTDKKQSTVSRLEDTEYGRVSVQTLLDIAKAVGVAVVVRFVDYPTFLGFAGKMSTPELQPDTIVESLKKASLPSPKLDTELPWMKDREQPMSQEVGSALLALQRRSQQGELTGGGRIPWN